MSTYSLLKVINLWSHTKEVTSNPVLLKHLKTALKLYVLIDFDKRFESKLKSKEFDSFCHQSSIQNLQPETWMAIFNDSFSLSVQAEKTSRNTKGNYSSALGRFLKWMKEETWYQEIFLHNLPERTPPFVTAKRKTKKRISDYNYGLDLDQLPKPFRDFIECWKEFWVGNNALEEINENRHQSYPSREELVKTSAERRQRREEKKLKEQETGTFDKPILTKLDKDKTLRDYASSISRFLGWCVHIEGYSIDEITPEWITDKILLEDYVTYLVHSRGCGHHSGLCMITASLSVAKYLNCEKSKQSDWSDIPSIRSLRNLSANYQRAMVRTIFDRKAIHRIGCHYKQSAPDR